MSASIWLWSFTRPVSPEQAAAATKAAGLGDEWVPVLPFSEVATRAVGDLKAKRSTEPGVIIWEARGKRWFADLVAREFVFESPRNKAAKTIKARLDDARQLLPRDLSAYMEATVRDWGAVHLMGDLWLVPEVEGSGLVLAMARGLPGAAVAAIPIDGGSGVAGEVLSLLAGRLSAVCADAVAGLDGLEPETLRRRTARLSSGRVGFGCWPSPWVCLCP